MGESLSKVFINLEDLPGLYSLQEQCTKDDFDSGSCFTSVHHLSPSFGGIFQLVFLAFVYGSILFQASNLIAEGSELLLLIPKIAPIVGSVVIPILGAVPDGAMVLFSGLGDNAQEQLQVGVGALAGSTIMLLTVPWTLAVIAGRVSVVDGTCTYKRTSGKWKKLDPSINKFLDTGVEPSIAPMKSGAKTMFLTSISYIVIQGAAFAFSGEPDKQLVKDESIFALSGLLLCISLFFFYLWIQIKNSGSDQVLQQIVADKRETAIKEGILSLQGAFYDAIQDYGPSSDFRLLEEGIRHQNFEKMIRKFFDRYDVNGDETIDKHELKLLLKDLHVANDPETIDYFMKEMDSDSSGDVHFDEFVGLLFKVLLGDDVSEGTSYGSFVTSGDRLTQLRQHHERLVVHQESSNDEFENAEIQSAESDEEEEIPEDLARLPPDAQRRAILLRSFKLMGVGTALVLLFSDPMVDVMSEVGAVLGVPPFYISFILAPLASNASELIASYSYAMKKTTKTITISLTSLEGAAIMNNTFCLGIFLALVYFRQLQWKFSAETISILFVELCMVYVATRKVQTVRMAFFVLSLFPVSLLLVATLENVFGLD